MNLVTTFPAGTTHVLATLEFKNQYRSTLRKVNENGYNVFETQLGQLVLSIPYQEDHGDAPDAYWTVRGFFAEADGEIAKKAFEQDATLRGCDVMRGLRSEEKVIRIPRIAA